MALIRLNQFRGRFPAAHPTKLSDAQAQVAENVDLRSGTLAPANIPPVAFQSNLGLQPEMIHKTRYGTWLELSWAPDMVDSVVGDDPYDRVFYLTGSGEPRVSNKARALSSTPYPGGSLRLGVPIPDSPTLTVMGTPDDPEDEPEIRFYVVTVVNEFGEEGPPSDPSGSVEVRPGEYVNVSYSKPTGDYDITKASIYRTDGGPYQFVQSKLFSNGSSIDDTLEAQFLQEELPSTTWYAPPGGLKGLTSVAGGFLTAHRGNEALFSELGLPHAWPFEYRQSLDYPIVGVGSFGNTAVYCTTGTPYIATGATPESMVLQKMDVDEACTNPESIVSMQGRVVYASPDGLVSIGSNGARVITQGVFTIDQWRALNPYQMKGASLEGAYVCFHNNGSFIISPALPEAGIIEFDWADNTIGGRFEELHSGDLYFADGDDIRRWGDLGAPATYRWRSRRITVSAPEVMKFAQVRADVYTYPVTLRVYADGALQTEILVSSGEPHRLAFPSLAREYEVEVESKNEVYEILVSTTAQALRGV